MRVRWPPWASETRRLSVGDVHDHQSGRIADGRCVRQPPAVRRPAECLDDFDVGDETRRAAIGAHDPHAPTLAAVGHERDLPPVRRERRAFIDGDAACQRRRPLQAAAGGPQRRLPVRDVLNARRDPSGDQTGSMSPEYPSVSDWYATGRSNAIGIRARDWRESMTVPTIRRRRSTNWVGCIRPLPSSGVCHVRSSNRATTGSSRRCRGWRHRSIRSHRR